MYLVRVDKFVYLLLSNVKKVVLKVIKVTIIELVFVKGYVFYTNNSVKFRVLNVIDIYGVVAY